MQREKVFFKLLIIVIIVLGIGVHYYFKNKNIFKYSNIEQLKYSAMTNTTAWGKGIENNGVETCLYKSKEETVYR
ncbi:MAG: hypothetical protein ACRDDY_18075 [Clostridium sp.]|uniref:hypothetical protein n=1 Tax=Clostridium sp. TaxID=1506 RepID=UPI003EE4A5B7